MRVSLYMTGRKDHNTWFVCTSRMVQYRQRKAYAHVNKCPFQCQSVIDHAEFFPGHTDVLELTNWIECLSAKGSEAQPRSARQLSGGCKIAVVRT